MNKACERATKRESDRCALRTELKRIKERSVSTDPEDKAKVNESDGEQDNVAEVKFAKCPENFESVEAFSGSEEERSLPKTSDGLEDEDVEQDNAEDEVKEFKSKVKRTPSMVREKWRQAYNKVQLAITEGKTDEVTGVHGELVARTRRSRLANLKWKLVLKRLEEENSNRSMKKEISEEEIGAEKMDEDLEKEQTPTLDSAKEKQKTEDRKTERSKSRDKREDDHDDGSRSNTLRARSKRATERLRERSVSATRALVEKSKELVTNTLTRRGRSKDRRRIKDKNELTLRVDSEEDLVNMDTLKKRKKMVTDLKPEKQDVKEAVTRKLEDKNSAAAESDEDSGKNGLRIEEEEEESFAPAMKPRSCDARQTQKRKTGWYRGKKTRVD